VVHHNGFQTLFSNLSITGAIKLSFMRGFLFGTLKHGSTTFMNMNKPNFSIYMPKFTNFRNPKICTVDSWF
jgi:hypothetical protein